MAFRKKAFEEIAFTIIIPRRERFLSKPPRADMMSKIPSGFLVWSLIVSAIINSTSSKIYLFTSPPYSTFVFFLLKLFVLKTSQNPKLLL